MASRPSWEGYVTFNLISIPVKAYTAAATGGGKIGFHMLHAKCNHRIKYKKVCPIHGEVSNDDIVMGYEYEKGHYVAVNQEDRSKLREKDDHAIAIDTFVSPDAIDPIYFGGRTYYLLPNGNAAQKPYAVFIQAMAEHDRHAIAQVVLSGRGHVAVLRPFGGLLLMTLLSYEGEIKPIAPFVAEVGDVKVSPQERKLASTLVDSATSDEFELGRYKNDYAARLAKLIERKSKGASRRTESASPPPVIDLMDALRKSIARSGRGNRRSTAVTTRKPPSTRRRSPRKPSSRAT